MFRAVFWVVLPCKMIVDNHFTRQYNPEDSSEHHTRRRENLKSHTVLFIFSFSRHNCLLVKRLNTPFFAQFPVRSKTQQFWFFRVSQTVRNALLENG
jgi:hypothetical protein